MNTVNGMNAVNTMNTQKKTLPDITPDNGLLLH